MAAQLFENYKSALEEHIKSPAYRANLKDKKKKLWVPDFSDYASANATILAILQDPSGSDPEKKTGRCCLTNTDATATNQKTILDDVGIDWENDRRIVFWNFYGAIGSFNNTASRKSTDIFWAERMGELIAQLNHLKVAVVCGIPAWYGMRYYTPKGGNGIPFIFSPHTAQRGLNSYNGWERARNAWRLAKKIALD